jgi:hypothetical protein
MKANRAQNKADGKTQEQKQKDYAVWASLTYLVVGAFLLKYYRYQINPDGISYISIAKKYLAGNFGEAVNGYWSPLFCWLLAPLLSLDIEPLLAAKILNLLIGAPIIFIIAGIARGFSVSVGARRIMVFTAIPVILLFSVVVITPDLLAALLMLIYFLFIFKTDYSSAKRNGVFCGFWGGVAYLAKSYSLPFFICHFTLMNFLHYFRCRSKEARSKLIVNSLIGFAAFGVISGAWITALSLKYHRFVYSTAGGDHVTAFIRPKNKSLEPMFYQGFLAPPNAAAISAWEDPSYLEYPQWSPFESSDAFSYYITHVRKNIRKIYDMFKQFSFLSVPIVIAGGLFFLQRPGKILAQYQIVYPLVSLFLFAGGYSLVIVEERYIWATFFLLMILSVCIIDRLLQNDFFTASRKAVVYFFFVISFAYRPVVFELPSAVNTGKSYYQLSQNLKTHIRPGSRIASNSDWMASLYLAYYLDVPYYGIPKSNTEKQTLDKELQKYHINYYLIWENYRLVNIATIQ